MKGLARQQTHDERMADDDLYPYQYFCGLMSDAYQGGVEDGEAFAASQVLGLLHQYHNSTEVPA